MYQKAREYLNEITKYGSVPGLETIRELLRRFHNPQNDLKFVHVAGTNGKGSTVAFISAILEQSGYKTGRYTSPSVFSYREKIQVNGVNIQKEALAKITFQIKEVIEEMVKEGFAHPTIFEVETALAFLYFKQEECEIVVLETGLGGLLDATNIVEETLVAVLCSISKDHIEFLGDSMKEIASHKVGIIKSSSTVVSTCQSVKVMEVIQEKCRKENHLLIEANTEQVNHIFYKDFKIYFHYDGLSDIEIRLAGSYQVQNAILAIEVVKALRTKGFDIENSTIKNGLKLAKWAGRFSIIRKEPLVIIDGAHNADAARVLKNTVETYFKDKKLVFVLGVFADKDYEEIVRIMAGLAWKVITITIPNNPRALNGKVLAEVVKKYNKNVTYKESLKLAAKECMQEKEGIDAILAFGSLSYLSEFEKEITN